MHKSATTRWSTEELNAARMQGDPAVDKLVAEVLGEAGEFSNVGRLGYNRVLDIADRLVDAPELALVSSSNVSRELNEYPKELTDYFYPTQAPEWLDESKLERASQLWDQNMLAILGVLYCASLPSCYLMKNGIPALYETAKLKDPKYILQRIYETGLFLDTVMSPGGLQIIHETEQDLDEYVSIAANRLDPDAGWHWEGRALRRSNHDGPALDHNRLIDLARDLRPKANRYIWGKGYIVARKVRFLHASMRFMLTQPNKVKPFAHDDMPHSVAESFSRLESGWNQAEWGVPVNQEDLAYTMLTFGYVIPVGLRRWGLLWTTGDREAFLHLWKLVGHIMGIKDGLLPDNWLEAEQLFNLIHQEQAGPSDQGKKLTSTLMGVLRDYLPPFGLNRVWAPLLIRHQLGSEYAAMILPDESTGAAREVPIRLLFRAGLLMFRAYFLVRGILFRLSPRLAAFMGGILSNAGEDLIESWRGSYTRKPFYVPADANTWHRVPNADEGFREQVSAWRRKVFGVVALGVGFLICSSMSFGALVVTLSLGYWKLATVPLGISVGTFLLALIALKWLLPWISRKRPKIIDGS